jgi:WD40 repeat protein
MIDEGSAIAGVDAKRPQVDAQHPWPGLPAFSEADRDFFFGRDSEAEGLTERIELHRLTVLFGMSGLGKSSLLRAGVFPRLRKKGFLPVYLRLNFHSDSTPPSDQIAHELERACRAVGGDASPRMSSESAWEYLHRKEVSFWTDRNYLLTPVLVFDQFEELFRSSNSGRQFNDKAVEVISDLGEGRVPAAVKERLLRHPELGHSFSSSVHRYRVVLSLREDYLADLEDLKPRMPSVGLNRMRLSHLSGNIAAQAVLDAGRAGGIVEDSVAIGIVRFVGESETHKPAQTLDELRIEPALMSVICRELNNERLEKGALSISLQQLERDKSEILRKFYEDAFRGVSAALRAFVEDRLVTSDGMRELVVRQTILGTQGIEEAQLDELINRRVLRQEERDGRRLIELTHDRLAPVAKASRQDRLKADAERLRRRSLRVISALLIVLGSAAVYLFWRTQTSVQTARANELVAYSNLLRETDPSQLQASLLLAIEALRNDPSENRIGVVREVARLLPIPIARVGYGDPVYAVAVTADGAYAAAQPTTGPSRIWDVRRNDEVARLTHDAHVNSLAFSPDGAQLATADADGHVTIWRTQDGLRQLVLPRPKESETKPESINSVTFHPNGRYLATASDDHGVRLWDLATEELIGSGTHDASAHIVAFNSVGDHLASAGDDGRVRFWSVTASGLKSLERGSKLPWPGGAVSSLAFGAAAAPATPVQSANLIPPGWLLAGSYSRQINMVDLQEGTSRLIEVGSLRPTRPPGVEVRQQRQPASLIPAPSYEQENRRGVSTVIVSTSGVVNVAENGVATLWMRPPDRPAPAEGWTEQARFIHQGPILSVSVASAARPRIVVIGDAAGDMRVWLVEDDNQINTSKDATQIITWACRHVTRNLTLEEKSRYVNESREPTCAIAPHVEDAKPSSKSSS